jgi:hypothetical protein
LLSLLIFPHCLLFLHYCAHLQINDGSQPTWHLRAESVREKKSWIVRLCHVHAIVRWVSAGLYVLCDQPYTPILPH